MEMGKYSINNNFKTSRIFKNTFNKKGIGGNPLAVQWLGLIALTARVQFLVGGLRSHKPLGTAKKNYIKLKSQKLKK